MATVLVVGTRNKKKLGEIREIYADLPVDLRDLSGWPDLPDVVEDADTFEGNARKKASEVARQVKQWVLAEDSGLVVPALNGAPGVYSARYAGTQGNDAANNVKLMNELAELERLGKISGPAPAYYICVAALSDPTGAIQTTTEGRCNGVLLRELRGTGGFGYDPLFLVQEYHQTFGELNAVVKHALSHRARALTQLRPALRRLLPT
jgi:XTP/dITP diphosphohydrolase